MTAFMIVVTGALLGLLILIDPSPRNLRTLKIGAFVGVLSLLAAWTWPIQVGMGLIALFLLGVVYGLKGWLLLCALFLLTFDE
jgi:hypothetical protein